MQIVAARLSDYAIIDASGKMSVLGIFENIYASNLPTTHAAWYLTFGLELNYAELGKDFRLKVEMTDSDGKVMFNLDTTGNFKGDVKVGRRTTLPVVMQLPPTTFESFGAYSFNIWLNDDLKGQVEFELMQTPTQPS